MAEREVDAPRYSRRAKPAHRRQRAAHTTMFVRIAVVVVVGGCAGAIVRAVVASGPTSAPVGARPGVGRSTTSTTAAPPTSTTALVTSTTAPVASTTTAPVASTTTTTSTAAGLAGSRSTVAASATVATAPPLPPASVLVEVLNGSGAAGAATSAATALHGAGFLLNGTGNAASFTHVENVAEYSAGSVAAARTLALWVTGGTQLVEVPGLAPNEVYLVLGSSFHGLSG